MVSDVEAGAMRAVSLKTIGDPEIKPVAAARRTHRTGRHGTTQLHHIRTDVALQLCRRDIRGSPHGHMGSLRDVARDSL